MNFNTFLQSRVYIGVLVTALLCSYFLTRTQGSFFLQDSEEYIEIASLDNGALSVLTMKDNPDLATKRPFIYPLFISLFGIKGLILIQNLLLIYVFYRLKVKLNIRQGTLYTALIVAVALSFNVFIYTHKIMTEVVLMTMIWVLFDSYDRSMSTFQQLGFVITFVALSFVKPVCFLLPFFLLPFLFFKVMRKPVLIWSIGLSILLNLTYMGYNKQRFGAFEFSSIQHINSLNYNYLNWKISTNDSKSAIQEVDSLNQHWSVLQYGDFVSASNAFVLQQIKQEPMSYAAFHLKGAAKGVVDPGRFDLESMAPDWFSGQSYLMESKGSTWEYMKSLGVGTLLILALLAFYNVLRFTGVAVALWGDVKSKDSRYVLGYVLIAFFILASGAINASRFMVPIVPLIIFMALRPMKKSIGAG